MWLQAQLARARQDGRRPTPLQVWAAQGAEVVGAFFFPRHRVTSIRAGEALVAIGIVGRGSRDLPPGATGGRRAPGGPWVGLVAYGAGMGLLVAAGRNTFLWTGTASRYSAIGAITAWASSAWRWRCVPAGPTVARAFEVAAVAGRSVSCASACSSAARRRWTRLDGTPSVPGPARRRPGDEAARRVPALVGEHRASSTRRASRTASSGPATTSAFATRRTAASWATTSTRDRSAPPCRAGVRAEVVRLEAGDVAVPLGMVFDGWVEGAASTARSSIDLDGNVIGAGGHGPVRRGLRRARARRARRSRVVQWRRSPDRRHHGARAARGARRPLRTAPPGG